MIEIEKFNCAFSERLIHLTLTSHNPSSYLALIYYKGNEVMGVTAIFTPKLK